MESAVCEVLVSAVILESLKDVCCCFQFELSDVCSLGLACDEPHFMEFSGSGTGATFLIFLWYNFIELRQ